MGEANASTGANSMQPYRLRLTGVPAVLVVSSSTRRHHLDRLVESGARVTVVGTPVSTDMARAIAYHRVTHHDRAYCVDDLNLTRLIVSATGSATADLARDAEQRQVILLESPANMPAPHPRRQRSSVARGSVALIGGGPGAADLITVRGRRLLELADVVIADRLAPRSLLTELAAEVEVIDASKIPYGPRVSQQRINELLVQHARAGRRVARLKGGDPFVFGRGYEELIACTEADIPVTVVPGVTSALAAPAAALLPISHRSVNHEVTIVSGHVRPHDPTSLVDWAALGRLRGTLVLLMAVENAGCIATELMANGRPPGTPVAVIARATLPGEQVVRTSLAHLSDSLLNEDIRPPAVIVVGPVAGLSPTSTSWATIALKMTQPGQFAD
ncbi:uroporphyrinogen-III C-methyltransferase [Pseudonocardia sulfidoxydans NBRC 16205]|uniref:uroporphyrinogen-III C-methyltransferase n=3 Tax=Pseudonocardia sulfidoxydans TaxID=54011 RepID=A0A511DQA1_9PSEU|nr:uroporphyrinogen-III C-methyltransferase [Pseudonocardia sulfidoxydans NBRC 16205]